MGLGSCWVDQEYQGAQTAYGLQPDEKLMTRSACLARLRPRRQDLWMDRLGDQFRRANDRKHRWIAGLLRVLGLAHVTQLRKRCELAGVSMGPPKNTPHQTQNYIWNQSFSGIGEKAQTQKSFRISKNVCKNGSAQTQTQRARG
jgi:hypothetical protein